MRLLRTTARALSSKRGGFAMIAVLFVLLALFVLATPYLMGIRRADRESERVFDRTAARLALEDAARHARAQLDATHPAVDTSPYWDSKGELAIDNQLDPEFMNANDPNGVMWDLDATDLSGLVDLGSASPGVLANLLGQHTWLAKAAAAEDASLKTASTRGFAREGFLWVGGERMAFLESDGSTFGKLERELFGDAKVDAVNPDCDFSLPRTHDAGAPVLGLAAFAVPRWRMGAETAVWRTPADFDQVEQAFAESLGGSVDELAFELLKAGATTFGGVGAGPRWQRATRLLDSVVGGNDCALRVEEAHYFNPGTTIEITNGAITEMALVREVAGSVVKLERVLLGDYDAFDAVVRPLARRPVNLNSAPAEVLHALFLGLKLRRRNARITDREATRLVEEVLEERPFTGFEDFLNRVVLPAAGLKKDGADDRAFMDAVDAEALYKNGLNANDRALEFSTMPFAFTTRGTFGLSLRSSINAKSGIERASLERDQVEVMVPQRELMRLWTRQEDFDEELRLAREAPLWSTGPIATSLASNGASPPSRFAAHFGTLTEGALAGELAPGFASREGHGWAQLFATRLDDLETDYHTRHVQHMDRETSNLEGMDLSRAGAYSAKASDPNVEWTRAQGDFLRPFSFAMWIKPERRASSAGGLYFDLGDAAYLDTDRVSVSEEGTDLVVSVLDAGGDHGLSALEERTEVRVPIVHFPLNTWTHLSIDVRGSRPDQVTVLVDGMARGETGGLTKLATNLGETATTIQVDSTDGFGAVGERCVVQIGNEIIEAEVMGPTTLLATPNVVGVNAGIGGRAAREQEQWVPDGALQKNQGAKVVRNHPALSSVQLYGYSHALRSPAPVGSTSLPAALGPFAVAEVNTVEGGTENKGDLIEVMGLSGARRLGSGLKGQSSKATGLVLRRGDDPMSGDSTFLSAFNDTGGYALLVQREMTFTVDNSIVTSETIDGEPLGGMELIRYSGINKNILQLAARGGAVRAELKSGTSTQSGADTRAFVTDFDDNVNWGSGPNGDEELMYQLFVVPISIPAPNVFANQQQFLNPAPGVPEFAQITRLKNDRNLTEWICYDKIVVPPSGAPPQFVRDHPDVLERVRKLIAPGLINADVQRPPPSPPQGGGPGLPPKEGGLPIPGGPGRGILSAVDPAATSASVSTEPAALGTLSVTATSQSPSQDSASALDTFGYWKGDLGVAEDQNYFLTSAVRKMLNFRGVMGTFPHAHPAGTMILPVFRIWRDETDVGIPGAGDRAWLIFENSNSIGEPVSIHRSYLPDVRYPLQGWLSASYSATAGKTSTELFEEARLAQNSTSFGSQVFIALEQPIGIFLPPSQGSTGKTGAPFGREMRELTRLVKFPSGELPRAVDSIAVGGSFGGASRGQRPDAIVDELEFGATLFGGSMSRGEVGRGAAMVLESALGLGTATIEIAPRKLRDARGFFVTGASPLRDLPQGGGLLRIGEELIAYDDADPGGTSMKIAPGGRGMLGTEEQPHRVGESIYFLSHVRTTTTLGRVGPADADLALADLHGLPPNGTLLVGNELLHYTHADANRGAGVVGMPRASKKPGERDGKGGALFRGRYGTAASAHVTGTPAVLFPTRYLDRWADGAEAPELAYFGFAASQTNAYWRSTFFEESEPQHPGAQLGLLVRASPEIPWDANPDKTDGLWLFDKGQQESKSLALGVQADLLEWRVFVRYAPGSFDFISGLSHGWKTTPELRFVGAEFVAPRVTLFREDR